MYAIVYSFHGKYVFGTYCEGNAIGDTARELGKRYSHTVFIPKSEYDAALLGKFIQR